MFKLFDTLYAKTLNNRLEFLKNLWVEKCKYTKHVKL